MLIYIFYARLYRTFLSSDHTFIHKSIIQYYNITKRRVNSRRGGINHDIIINFLIKGTLYSQLSNVPFLILLLLYKIVLFLSLSGTIHLSDRVINYY